jgi:predicted TIM-barrel fold metal-dependent hydrolase
VTIDAWMQHPSAAFLAEPMFDSLRRWARGRLGDGSDGEIPAAATVAAMDAAGVRTGMLCAWWGPRGPLITNDSVAAMVTAYPGRFAGVASVDLARPMDAVRELRRCVRGRRPVPLRQRRTRLRPVTRPAGIYRIFRGATIPAGRPSPAVS